MKNLIKTINELKAIMPNFVSNLSDIDSMPNFASSEAKHLVPITGTDLYEYILGKYDLGTLTTGEEELWEYMAKVSAAHAFYDEISLFNLTYTDNGLMKFAATDSAPITKWEFEKMQQSLINLAYDSTENLLKHLYTTLPAQWVGSEAFEKYNSLLIKSGSEFSKLYTLQQPYRTFYDIHGYIEDAQRLYLQEALGETLLKYCIDNDFTELKQIKYALKKSLAFFTIKQCCLHSQVQFSADGFTVLGSGLADSAASAGRRNAAALEIEAKINACNLNGQDFLNLALQDIKALFAITIDATLKANIEGSPMYSIISIGYTGLLNETRKGIFRI